MQSGFIDLIIVPINRQRPLPVKKTERPIYPEIFVDVNSNNAIAQLKYSKKIARDIIESLQAKNRSEPNYRSGLFRNLPSFPDFTKELGRGDDNEFLKRYVFQQWPRSAWDIKPDYKNEYKGVFIHPIYLIEMTKKMIDTFKFELEQSADAALIDYFGKLHDQFQEILAKSKKVDLTFEEDVTLTVPTSPRFRSPQVTGAYRIMATPPNTPFNRLKYSVARSADSGEYSRQPSPFGKRMDFSEKLTGRYAKDAIRPGASVPLNTSLRSVMDAMWGVKNKNGTELFPGLLTGFLEGDPDSKSPSLDYIESYFGGEYPIPLNVDTYNAFNETMYKAFLDGEIPGKVTYYQPSIDDVRLAMRQSGLMSRQIDFTQTPDARKRSLKTMEAEMLGMPGLDYAPKRVAKKPRK